MKIIKIMAFLFVLLVISMTLESATAYNTTSSNGASWIWTVQPVQVNSSSLPSTWRTATNNSMNSWNAAGANFTYINQQNNSIHTIVTQSATLNQNVLGQEFPTAGVWVSGVKWQKTASLVKINTGSGYVWSTASTCPSKSYDVESVIVHELGHTLGLFHENSNTAYTMHEYLSNGTTDHRSLETDDKNGSKAIYP